MVGNALGFEERTVSHLALPWLQAIGWWEHWKNITNSKKRYLQCLCSSSVQTKHVHMKIKHTHMDAWTDSIPLLYLLFFYCLRVQTGHKQFILVLPQQQDGKAPVLFRSWSDSYDEHRTHKKANKPSIIYYHSTYVNIHQRSGGNLGRACDIPVTGLNKRGIPWLQAVSLEKNMCVVVMLPCGVICSFSTL